MSPPGDYIADVSEGITRPEDLPAPCLERHSRNYPRRRCAGCGHSARRYGVAHRRLHDLGDSRRGRPIDLVLLQSQHRCPTCRRCFLADVSDLALPKSRYTLRVQRTAVRLAIEDGLPIGRPVGICGGTTASLSPGLRSRTGSRRLGKKSLADIDTEYLDRVLATFSGYLAIDELYDGPFCVISVVDNRMYQRLAYRVLEKSPTKRDVRRFLREFAARLASRGCRVRGITTDGSSLYPQALAKVFPGGPTRSASSTCSRRSPERSCTPWPRCVSNGKPRSPSSRAAGPAGPVRKRLGVPAGCSSDPVICSRTAIYSSDVICGPPRKRPCDN